MHDLSKTLLITDLDGTLLPPDKVIPESDLEKIRQFQRDGGSFTIATGRSLPAVEMYLDMFELKIPIILYNGSVVYDCGSKKAVVSRLMPQPASRQMVRDVIERFPDIGIDLITADDKVYVPKLNRLEEEHLEITKVEAVFCGIDDIPDNWYKLILMREEHLIPELAEFVRSKGYEGIHFVNSHNIYYEALPAASTKGSALTDIRRLCGYEDYTIYAAGDYNNDIEMLEAADVGICPSNAIDDVKQIADIVLPQSCSEHFISAAIDYIYQQKK